jgi:hypothetical protein
MAVFPLRPFASSFAFYLQRNASGFNIKKNQGKCNILKMSGKESGS